MSDKIEIKELFGYYKPFRLISAVVFTFMVLGILVSGGERQRVAIARALLKKPDVLILDEATANLDSVSESYIKGAIETDRVSRTKIIIAHRLSTIKHADTIVVMKKGRVLSQGTYSELCSTCLEFQKLVKEQTK